MSTTPTLDPKRPIEGRTAKRLGQRMEKGETVEQIAKGMKLDLEHVATFVAGVKAIDPETPGDEPTPPEPTFTGDPESDDKAIEELLSKVSGDEGPSFQEKVQARLDADKYDHGTTWYGYAQRIANGEGLGSVATDAGVSTTRLGEVLLGATIDWSKPSGDPSAVTPTEEKASKPKGPQVVPAFQAKRGHVIFGVRPDGLLEYLGLVEGETTYAAAQAHVERDEFVGYYSVNARFVSKTVGLES